MAKATEAVARARAARKTSKTITIKFPITPRLQEAIQAYAEYKAADREYSTAAAPMWAAWSKLSRKQQDSGRHEPGWTRETRALKAKRDAACKRLQTICKPMRAEIESGPLPPERILEATLAGWFDLTSSARVVEALTNLVVAVVSRGIRAA
jgi:hypothetical protein